ncbi:MAG: GNAT family N-acetyltransferase [Candidatus Bathyarchaeales archaeon]
MKTLLRIKVEELAETDASEIALLFRKVWCENAQEYTEEWRKSRALSRVQILEEMKKGYRFFGIRIGCKLVGVYKALLTSEGLFGEHQSVHPDFRRMGLATVMYRHFINYAKTHKIEKVYVNILLDHVASRKIVEKMGFHKAGNPYEQSKGMLVQTYEKQI